MKIVRLAAVLLLLVAVAAGYLVFRLARPYQAFSGTTYLEFARGTPTSQMGVQLAEAGVVRSRFDFWLARLAARGRSLQAGEYRFDRPASALEVVRRIARGDIFYYELVVPEGKNMFDIAALVEQLGVFPANDFLAAARNPALIRDLDPAAPSLEGYLFPNTYRLNHSTTPERLCRMMTGKFREEWKKLNTDASIHRTVTLASLVEKEGKLAEERPVIAAVFDNRLRIGMKLDCDPTTIYAALLENRYRGTIFRSDLDSDQPYNTYRHTGLPPGPIANPGVASLKAVLAPADSEALYFVLRPGDSGAHEFSRNIAQHEAAIAKYRRGLQR
ncbi:MAG TPA: endolytic transglycosylase MltG [Bryobacteraceae bacterium]|nr:endolytic transglycosylase MltG [Bryobacteraceae bacterium]